MALIQSTKNEHYLTFDDDKHRYTLNGERVPGATTFGKGGYPVSEQLQGWKVGQGSLYTAKVLLRLAREKKLKLTKTFLDEVIKRSKQAHKKVADHAADIGTIVHDFAYLTEIGRGDEAISMLGALKDMKDWDKVENGVRLFQDWKSKNVDQIVLTEAIVASVVHEFGGKFDRLADRPGIGLVLSDFKTSSGIYVDQFIQCGAYSVAIKEWLGLDVKGFEILRFGKNDGTFEPMLITSPAELLAFEDQAITCRRTYKFRNKWENDKRFKFMGGSKK